eukprot:scaffold80_cov325-Pavlova_lutheri.AAC.55
MQHSKPPLFTIQPTASRRHGRFLVLVDVIRSARRASAVRASVVRVQSRPDPCELVFTPWVRRTSVSSAAGRFP